MCEPNYQFSVGRPTAKKTVSYPSFAFLMSAMLALSPLGCHSPTPMNSSSASTPLVEVSAADAAAAGLPAVEVRIAKTKLPLIPDRLPFAGAYVSASGPPGGPLGLTVIAGAANAEEAAKSLREEGHEDVQTGQVNWRGKPAPAISSRHGQENAWSQELQVLAVTAGGKGVWIAMAAGAGQQTLTPAQAAARPPFSDMLAAVEVRAP